MKICKLYRLLCLCVSIVVMLTTNNISVFSAEEAIEEYTPDNTENSNVIGFLTETPKVDFSEASEEWYFDVSLDDCGDEADVFLAIYDENDVLLSTQNKAFLADSIISFSLQKISNALYYKVFVFNKNLEPLCYPYIGYFTTSITSVIITFNTGAEATQIEKQELKYGAKITMPDNPIREGYTFAGWYSDSSYSEDSKWDFDTCVYNDTTLYAYWTLNEYAVSWLSPVGASISVERISSLNEEAPIGALSNGSPIYYGDVLNVSYTANAGYSITATGASSITVTGNVTSSDIYASTELYTYTVSWSSPVGANISVERTSSLNKNASIGPLSSGNMIYYGDVLSVSYTANTGYSITNKGLSNITVTGNVTSNDIYAATELSKYTINWSTPTGASISVNRTSSPNKEASTGALSSGSAVYYGDVLSVSYTANTGYSIATKGATSITVTGNVTSSEIYATTELNKYTVSWSVPTGASISVSRTSSPNKKAATGALSSGSAIYYGDVLNVSYTANAGYSIATKGATSITVKGNVTSSDIYATTKVNSYTYNVVYKATNGKSLGSTTVTKNYGTTNTITPPEKSGYLTPAPQTVKWDSTSAKTITFTYTPLSEAKGTLKNATLAYTLKGLNHNLAVQNFYIATKYIYITQRSKTTTYLSRLKKDDAKKEAVYVDEMTLLNAGHGQSLDMYTYNNINYLYVGCKPETHSSGYYFSLQIARIEYKAGKQFDYTDLNRFSYMNYASKSSTRLGTTYRVAAGANSKYTVFRIQTEEGSVTYSIYDTVAINKLLDKNKSVRMDTQDARNACKYSFTQTGSGILRPNGSFQGVDILNDNEIYISGGADGDVPTLARMNNLGKNPKLISIKNVGNCEIEGVQCKDSRVYFLIKPDPNNKKNSQKIYYVNDSEFD